MSAANASDSSSSFSLDRRRSSRKRIPPQRYGSYELNRDDDDVDDDYYDDYDALRMTLKARKRRKLDNTSTTTSNTSIINTSRTKRTRTPKSGQRKLLDLPEELAQNILCNYLCTAKDLPALQETSRAFCCLTNSDRMKQNIRFILDSNDERLSLETSTDGLTTGIATANQSFPIVPSASSTLMSTDIATTITHGAESTRRVVQRLLPYAKHNNLDALVILGVIAVYVQDDLETGLSLLQKGASLKSPRCLYELALLLMRHNKTIGQDYLDQAANLGHAQAQLIQVNRHGISKDSKQQAQRELWADYRIGLHHLLANKPSPPRPRWGPFHCDNPYCQRITYRSTRRCREWLSGKPHSPEWSRIRKDVLDCGIDPKKTHFDAGSFYFVHRMPTCGGCRMATYCGAACQRLHWKQHKQACRVIMAQFDADDDDNNVVNHQNNGNGNGNNEQ